MFGHNRNSGIHWMRDYGDALHKYESTDNIRGRVKEPMKPLGMRRSVDVYSIRKREDGAIECVLYETPVVTFCPDGFIEIRDGMWSTVSTAYFIEEVTGFSSRLFNNSLCVSVMGMETRLSSGDVLRIKDGKMLNPIKDKSHYIKRAEANKVRKMYEDFLVYATALVRLKGGQFSSEEIDATFGKTENGVSQIPDEISRVYYLNFHKDMNNLFGFIADKSEDKHLAHYKATLIIANAFGGRTYGNRGSHNYTGCHIEEQAFKRAFNNIMLGFHRDEVFGVKEREEGEVKRDPYYKYFENGWKKLHEDRGGA